MHILTVADGIVEGSLRPEAKEEWLRKFEKKYAITIDRAQTPRKMGIALYRLAEQQMAGWHRKRQIPSGRSSRLS